MTPEQIVLVQESFQKMATSADQAAEIFYNNLFELDPELRGLFLSDMQAQGRKLMHMIGLAVHGLKTPDTLIPAVQELGKRHVVYGLEEKYYKTVGKALLLTLEQGLGADFTPLMREAWSATYALLCGVMKQAAYAKPQVA
jgi:hemoglobin-like flavoprotein